MVLVQFVVVLLRYVFGVSDVALDESVLYLHAALFTLGAGYTLQIDDARAGGHLPGPRRARGARR